MRPRSVERKNGRNEDSLKGESSDCVDALDISIVGSESHNGRRVC